MNVYSYNSFNSTKMGYDSLYNNEPSYESSIVSQFVDDSGSPSEVSSDDFSIKSCSTIYDNYSPRESSSTYSDDYTDDNFSMSSHHCLYDYSSLLDYDDRTTTTGSQYSNSMSTPDSIQSSSNNTRATVRQSNLSILQQDNSEHQQQLQQQQLKMPKNGILKYKDKNWNHHCNFEDEENYETTITQRTLDKIRECELEDVLQHARDIIKPDPKARITFCKQPVKVVQNSFRHLFSVKETFSKTGAFKYQTIYVTRKSDEDLGISLRHGDGWGSKDGIFISRVALGSIFDQYEVLTVGDELVLVNKVNVKKMTLNDAIRLMHIPEKLSITVKVLTPFSKKRFASSGMDAFKNVGGNNNKQNKQKVIAGTHNKGSSYKVAQMKIDNQESTMKHQQQKQQQGRGHHHHNNNKHDSNNKKKILKVVSPYRTVDGGKTVQQLSKQNLSPIKEFSTDVEPTKYRKRSIVRWSDQE